MPHPEVQKELREKVARVVDRNTYLAALKVLDSPGIEIDAAGPSGKTALCFAVEYLALHILQADAKVDLPTIRYKLRIIEDLLVHAADNAHVYDVSKESVHKLHDAEERIIKLINGKKISQTGVLGMLSLADRLRLSAIICLKDLFATAKNVIKAKNKFSLTLNQRSELKFKLAAKPIIIIADYENNATSRFLRLAQQTYVNANYQALCLDFPVGEDVRELLAQYMSMSASGNYAKTSRFQERLNLLDFAATSDLSHNVHFLDPRKSMARHPLTNILVENEAKSLLGFDDTSLRIYGIVNAVLNEILAHDGRVLVIVELSATDMRVLLHALQRPKIDYINIVPASDENQLKDQLEQFADQLPGVAVRLKLTSR